MLRIAITMLMNDSRKFLGIVLALSFTSFMMSLQPASFFGAATTMVSLVNEVRGIDLWVMEPTVHSISDTKPLSDAYLNRVKGISGVGWAVPLHKGSVRVRTADGNFISCTLYGIDDVTLIGGPATMVTGTLADVRQSESVLVDSAHARVGGQLTASVDGRPTAIVVGDSLEIGDRRARVVGLHRAVASPEQNPTLYTTYARAKLFTADRKILSYILVKLKADADTTAVVADIRHFTGLSAVTPAAFKARSIDHVLWSTGNMISFGIVTLITFFIGASVAAQAFASFARENLRYFGVIKAMGATSSQLVSMILVQAFIVAAIGFGIGIGAMSVLGWLLRDVFEIGVDLILTPLIISFSAVAVHVVCLGAALVSISRVLHLEPSVVFRG